VCQLAPGRIITSPWPAPIDPVPNKCTRRFGLTLERLGHVLRADECAFVDDLEVNCEAARALGMTAVRLEDARQAIAELDAAIFPQRAE
jgi:FMN phosphatase YigB (HAD superfamily)